MNTLIYIAINLWDWSTLALLSFESGTFNLLIAEQNCLDVAHAYADFRVMDLIQAKINTLPRPKDSKKPQPVKAHRKPTPASTPGSTKEKVEQAHCMWFDIFTVHAYLHLTSSWNQNIQFLHYSNIRYKTRDKYFTFLIYFKDAILVCLFFLDFILTPIILHINSQY